MKNHYALILQKARIIIPLVVIDVSFFSFVNPTNGNSFVTIIGCLLLAITIYEMALLLARIVTILIPISQSAQNRFAMFSTALLVFLVLMQSVGQLSLRDVLAVVPLVIVLYLYLGIYARHKPKADIS